MPATTEFQLAAPKSLFPQTWTLSLRYYYFGPLLAIRWPCDWLVVVIQSLVFDSLWPHKLHPCPSLSPRVCSNSCPLHHWCHPTISSSVAPLSSFPQSFPASWSFLVSQLFTSGVQSNGASASASVLPVNIQGWFPFRLTHLMTGLTVSLLSKGLSSLVQPHSLKV